MIFELKSSWKVGLKSAFQEREILGSFNTLVSVKCFEVSLISQEALNDCYISAAVGSVEGADFLYFNAILVAYSLQGNSSCAVQAFLYYFPFLAELGDIPPLAYA